MDRQKIFNTVYTKLMKQGCKAARVSGSCVYLAENGNRCGIGHIIPDGHAALQHVGGVFELFEYYDDLKELWEIESSSDKSFLESIQMAHDEVSNDEVFKEEFEFAMQEIANYNGLVVPNNG